MFRKPIHPILAMSLALPLASLLHAAQPGAAKTPMRPAGSEKSTSARGSMRSLGFLAALQQTAALSQEQQDSIRGLLAEQRSDVAAVREKTDAKIRAILNPEQQKKFDAYQAAQKAQRASKKRA